MKITALAGGTGAAKLLRGLGRVLDPRDLTVVVNTGDDTEIWGLHVSPDLDTVCYTLGGVIDERKGWGLTDETFHALDQIARYGEPVWFNLGDRDLATHLHRSRLLREGRSPGPWESPPRCSPCPISRCAPGSSAPTAGSRFRSTSCARRPRSRCGR